MTDTRTDFLIVGAGPAGASLACFLGEYGLSGIMIAAAPSTAETPRAHITNMAGLECLKDIGLLDDCLQHATPSDKMEHSRWCHDLAGEEYGRIYSWGHDPKRHGDYDAASPCKHVDLPQTLLEPILVNRAKNKGWDVKFNTGFVAYEQDDSNVIKSQVKDILTGQTYTITSQYLFGCDGARSQVMKQLDVPLMKEPGGGLAFNVYVEADMTRFFETRVGNLHWVIQPERDPPAHVWMSVVRMVVPWTRWMFIMFPKPDYNPAVHGEPTEQDWREEVRKQIGDDETSFKIIDISKWTVNEIAAERYSEGNIFCLGDAVHRHPPFNGLGSNTSIQDAYNLAWKIAYVHNNRARPSLLQTYSPERQPVGLSVVARANQGFRDHVHVWDALSITEPDLQKRMDNFHDLRAATPSGRQRRAALQAAIEGTAHEFHAVGQEMNQRYNSSAVYTADQGPRPPLPADPVLTHQLSTYPGARLPHAWINTRKPQQKFSTVDLAGHGAFSLFTGIGGEKWKEAAGAVGAELGVKINAFSIGWCQDYEDVYFEWARRREVQEDGCVLVRPDRFVCWRAMEVGVGEDACEVALRMVLKRVLGYEDHVEVNGMEG